jgi:hypothetical protein
MNLLDIYYVRVHVRVNFSRLMDSRYIVCQVSLALVNPISIRLSWGSGDV